MVRMVVGGFYKTSSGCIVGPARVIPEDYRSSPDFMWMVGDITAGYDNSGQISPMARYSNLKNYDLVSLVNAPRLSYIVTVSVEVYTNFSNGKFTETHYLAFPTLNDANLFVEKIQKQPYYVKHSIQTDMQVFDADSALSYFNEKYF